MYQLYYAKARVQQVLVSLDGLIDQIAQGGDDVEMAVTFPQGAGRERGLTKDRVGRQIDKLFCQRLCSIRVSGASAKFDPQGCRLLSSPAYREHLEKPRVETAQPAVLLVTLDQLNSVRSIHMR